MFRKWFRARSISRPSLVPTRWRPFMEELEKRELLAAKLTAILEPNGVLSIEGTEKADQIVVRQAPAGTGPISVQGVTIRDGAKNLPNVAANRVKLVSVRALGGTDIVRMEGVTLPSELRGGAGDDCLTGGAGSDTLWGDANNDTLLGGAGADTMDGGADNDLLVASGNFHFTLTATGLSAAPLTGGTATVDRLVGIERAALTASNSGHRMDASAFPGDVTLVGGTGSDTLLGGGGKSRLIGGNKIDVFDYLYGGRGPTEFLGGSEATNRVVGRPMVGQATSSVYVPSDVRFRKPDLARGSAERKRFFENLIAAYADQAGVLGKLNATSQANLEQLFNFLMDDPNVQDLRWMTYMIATALHETGDYDAAKKENGDGKPTSANLQNPKTAYWKVDGGQFFGRGYVQITWKDAYKEMSDHLAPILRRAGFPLTLNLEAYPFQALIPEVSYAILSEGVRTGFFNDVNWMEAGGNPLGNYRAANPNQWKGLSAYINDGSTDPKTYYLRAREIVNFFEARLNTDRAKTFVKIATALEGVVLEASEEFQAPPPPEGVFDRLLYEINQSIDRMRSSAVSNGVGAKAGVDLPLLAESLDARMGLSSRLLEPFGRRVEVGATSSSAVAASSMAATGVAKPNAFLATQAASQSSSKTVTRQQLLEALQRAGWEVEFLTADGTQTDANGDLMRLRYRKAHAVPVANYSVGGKTGFSYFDDRVNGSLAGKVSGTAAALQTDISLGIDRKGAGMRVYLKEGSGLNVGQVKFSGEASGSLALRNLAYVEAGGTINGQFGGGLRFKDVDGVSDGKLSVSHVVDGLVADIDGKLTVDPMSFKAKLPVVGSIGWGGTFTATMTDGVFATNYSLSTPDALSVLAQAAKGVFQIFGGGGLPVLGEIGGLLSQDKIKVGPISIPFNLSKELGLSDGLGWLLGGVGLSGDMGSLESIRTSLKSVHKGFDLLPGRALDIKGAAAAVQDLVEGKKVDLLTFQLEAGKEWKADVPLFKMIIPILPPALVAELGANFEAFVGYNAFFGVGVDTTGFYVHPNTRLGIHGGVRFTLEGGVSLAGLLGVKVGLGAGVRIEAGVRFADPDPTDGKIYFDELFSGNSANIAKNFLQSMNFYAEADAMGHARVKLDLPWPLPDVTLIDEQFRLAKLWDTHADRKVKDSHPDGKTTYRALALATDIALNLEAMVKVENGQRVLVLEGTDDSDSIRLDGTGGTVNVTWFGRGQGQIANIARVRFRGGKGADRLEADPTFDRPIDADGGESADAIFGGAGNDTLLGGAGDDEIFGLTGADRLEGGTGNDSLSGGIGNDTLLGQDGRDQLDGELNDDRLEGGNNDDILDGGSGNDTLLGDAGRDDLRGGSENDQLDGGTDGDQMDGGSGRDTLIGGSDAAADILDGGSEDDLLSGGAGNDILLGGDGKDTLRGEAGNDLLAGEAGDDDLAGGTNDDSLFGGSGNDLIFGNDGNDLLHGGEGGDKLYGDDANRQESGRDRFEIELGANETFVDEMNGGLDRDYIVVIGPNLLETTTGTVGEGGLRTEDGKPARLKVVDDDILVRRDRTTGHFVAGWKERGGTSAYAETRFLMPADVDAVIIQGRDGNDLLQVADDAVFPFELDGGMGNDTLQGGIGGDTLRGGAGNDLLRGNAGQDELHGDAGDDDLDGGTETDALYGGDNADTIRGGLGRDIAYGGDGNDRMEAGDDFLGDILFGEGDNDILIGGKGVDLLDGGTGNDSITGGALGDLLIGGAGLDTLLGQGGPDILLGEGEADLLHAADFTGADEAANPDWHKLYNDLLAMEQQLVDKLHALTDGEMKRADLTPEELAELDSRARDLNVQIEIANEAESDLLPYRLVRVDTLLGGEGDDTLHGSARGDFLGGQGGNDRLYYSLGSDTVSGGAGNDDTYVVGGTAGADTVDFAFDGDTAKTYVVVNGNRTEYAKLEIESFAIETLGGNDKITLAGLQAKVPAEGRIKVYGGDGDDTIDARTYEGATSLIGGAGNDVIQGGFITDTIRGGTGNDTLFGHGGNDFLDGDGDDAPATGTVKSPKNLTGDIRKPGGGIITIMPVLDDTFATIPDLLGEYVPQADQLDGGAGRDTLWGGNDTDTLRGGTEDDELFGGVGNDSLFGDDGADRLNGEDGLDTLQGGSGADSHIVSIREDDRITGYERGTDGLSIPNASVRTQLVDTDGAVWALLTDNWTWGKGQAVWTNTRQIALGTDGRFWWLARSGGLYYSSSRFNWVLQDSYVVDMWSDSNGNPNWKRAFSGGLRHFRYDSGNDRFWAIADNNMFINGNVSNSFSYRIVIDVLHLNDDFDGFGRGDGDWYINVSGWGRHGEFNRPEGHHGLGIGSGWFSAGTSFAHHFDIWEQDGGRDEDSDFGGWMSFNSVDVLLSGGVRGFSFSGPKGNYITGRVFVSIPGGLFG